MDSLLTEKQVSELLGWSQKTLQARRHRNQPPRYHKIGRSVRYSPEDVAAFIRQCRTDLPGDQARGCE